MQHKVVTERESPWSTRALKNVSFDINIDETSPDVTSLGERIQD